MPLLSELANARRGRAGELSPAFALLEASGQDQLVSHLYGSRREYRSVCERAGKSGNAIERCVISTFQVAGSLGFKGELRQWDELLRIGE